MIKTVVYNFSDEEAHMINVSRSMYTYFQYTTRMNGWHDDPYKHLVDSREDTQKFLKIISDNDLDLWAYCVLACTVSRSEDFSSPMKLYSRAKIIAWLLKLRNYCGTVEMFVEVAEVVMYLIEYQAENYSESKNRVYFTHGNLVKRVDQYFGMDDVAKTYLQPYHILSDRISELKKERIDPRLWVVAKYKKCIKAFKDNIAFSAIVNPNSLDPELKGLKLVTNDPWRQIREFLGISPSCEFPDGTIPKGWRPAKNDPTKANLDNVVKITGDGFYYYQDGTQRKGKSHYALNSYYTIGCTPENFEEFKSEWDNVNRVNHMPTWDEYNMYGPKDRWWNEKGESLNGRGKNVVWRKPAKEKK